MNTLAVLFAAVVIATPLAAAGQDIDLGEGYLCCNMRSDGSWISDSNYADSGKQMIPFGTPIRHAGWGRNRVHVDILGRRQSIGNDYSRAVPMEAFGRRYILQKDPRRKVEALPPKIRKAIESARVTRGMTREQVQTAIGYPMGSETPMLEASPWKYYLTSRAPFSVHFDPRGHVTNVHADPDTLAKVYTP